jgi:hypothetical protein
MCVDWGVSIRRACGAICFDTSTYHYKSRRTDQAAVERRIKEIAETRVRYGYRRVHVLLRREGWVINMKKTRRIYNELGLQLRNKHPEEAGEGQAARGSPGGGRAERCLGDGLRSRPARHGQEAPHPDHRRHPFAVLPGGRSPVQLSRRRRGADAGTGLRRSAIPRRSGSTTAASSSPGTWTCGPMPTTSRSTSPGRGSPPTMGSSRRSTASSGGMPERPLVHEPCRCPRKAGGLAQRLQRGSTPQRDRLQRPDRPAHSRWRNQPVIVTRAGKFQPPAVQGWGAAHKLTDSPDAWRELGSQVSGETRNWQSSNTSTASSIRADDTQPAAGKARSPSNGKWPKRVPRAAPKRDRS